MKKTPRLAVHYFSDEYLERSRAMKTEEILNFLENFRLIQDRGATQSRKISLKVSDALFHVFRVRCRLEGVRYQTQIKRLMTDWLGSRGD